MVNWMAEGFGTEFENVVMNVVDTNGFEVLSSERVLRMAMTNPFRQFVVETDLTFVDTEGTGLNIE